METKASVNQRFIQAVNYLLAVKSVKNKTELAVNLRLSKSKLSEILNERMNVGIDTIALFCLLYEIKTDWLLNEKGKMVRPDEFVPKENELLKIYLDNVDVAPFEVSNGIDYKELYLEAKYTIEVQKKYIQNLELEIGNKRVAG